MFYGNQVTTSLFYRPAPYSVLLFSSDFPSMIEDILGVSLGVTTNVYKHLVSQTRGVFMLLLFDGCYGDELTTNLLYVPAPSSVSFFLLM